MKKIMIALLLALSLLLVPAAASAAGVEVDSKSGDGTWTDDTWQVEVYPGETKSTILNLYNSSSGSLDTEVTIIPDSLDNGNIIFELDKSVFTTSGKSYTEVTLSVSANGSATPGIYTAELSITSETPSTGGGGGGGSDRTAPRVYDISPCAITETTADICWTTNEYSTSQVEYWTSPIQLSLLDTKYLTKHRVQLTDLTLGTLYSYIMLSEDRAGNLERSDTYTFTTLGQAPTEPEPVPPEPEKPEPVAPVPPAPSAPPVLPPPEEPIPWPLIGGLIAISIAGGVVLWWWLRRKRMVAAAEDIC